MRDFYSIDGSKTQRDTKILVDYTIGSMKKVL